MVPYVCARAAQDPLPAGGGRERAHALADLPADEAARAPVPVLRHWCTGVLSILRHQRTGTSRQATWGLDKRGLNGMAMLAAPF